VRAVLAIGGSDSSGCAGIAADIRAITASGMHAACALTCVTAQTRAGIVDLLPVPGSLVRSQIASAFSDLPVAAVKSGALGSAEAVNATAAELIRRPGIPYVLDPVLAATSGSELVSGLAIEAMRQKLFPLATLVTPNAPEAAALTGLPVSSVDEAERAARALVALGCRAVLVKGGHLDGDTRIDLLVTGGTAVAKTFEGPAIGNPNTRGSGCTLAAAIASRLAKGDELVEAINAGRAVTADAIHGGYDLAGRGPADAFAALRESPRGLEPLLPGGGRG
jgi:hydroxymethylpyrimidine/phosphomethylpyrimidine kinase